MDRNLALEFIRVTEAAAIAAGRWIGRGDKHRADGAAVKEMRSRFNQIDFRGTVVIGEGAKDEAPELYVGEKVGKGRGPKFDLAVDPLECTDSVAFGRYNAMSVIVAGSHRSLFSAPDVYMEKIAVGPKAKKAVRLNASVGQNIKNTAKALKRKVGDITVCILDRERHQGLIKQVRKTGARVRLITDGDVAGAIAPCLPETGIDMLLGIGASAEAVLAAAAIKVLGGQMFVKFSEHKEKHVKLIKEAGYNLNKIFSVEDLAKGKILTFTATGIIDGPLLEGVKYKNGKIITHSLVIRGQSGTIRYITTYHNNKIFK
ncbi:MAG: class II fructose-bisphosphatase [Candidatus Doudnabacteria bacterium]|nr:class II fructose-bisphosphatase [Candidatus Doudnabacteria bacterium]